MTDQTQESYTGPDGNTYWRPARPLPWYPTTLTRIWCFFHGPCEGAKTAGGCDCPRGRKPGGEQ